MIKRLIKVITFPIAFLFMVMTMFPLLIIDLIIYIITGTFGDMTNDFNDIIFELYDN